ncbi:MAG: acyltransferase family protein, partial [Lachnospiraceae bacterium]|nr:acyltransferase family protein [Lachnospiraceae bacterium]
SAYLFFRNFKIEQLLTKWKRRFFSLVIPYIIWNMVALILMLVTHNLEYKGIPELIYDGFLCIGNSGCVNGPLWYIFRLCEFVLLAPAIFYIVKNKKLILTIIVIALVFAANCWFKVGYSQFSYFLPVFILGAYLGENVSASFESHVGNNKFKWKYMLVSLTLLLGISYCTSVFASISELQMALRYISLLPFLGVIHSLKFDKPVKIAFGSMYFYCAHDIVYRIVRTVLLRLNLDITITYFALIVISFSILLVTYLFLKRFCNKFLKVLTGGR